MSAVEDKQEQISELVVSINSNNLSALYNPVLDLNLVLRFYSMFFFLILLLSLRKVVMRIIFLMFNNLISIQNVTSISYKRSFLPILKRSSIPTVVDIFEIAIVFVFFCDFPKRLLLIAVGAYEQYFICLLMFIRVRFQYLQCNLFIAGR